MSLISILYRLLPVLVLGYGLGQSNVAKASNLQSVTASFEQRLNQAEQRHRRLTAQIQKQREPELRQLVQLEAELIELRQQLAAYTRTKDEQFVSLQTLQHRLEQWQQQNRYISNLNDRYLGSSDNDANAFSVRLHALAQATRPQWHEAQAVGLDGQVIAGQQLRVGPLTWFIDNHSKGFFAESLYNSAEPNRLLMAASQPLTDWQKMPIDISQDKAIRIAAKQSGWLDKLKLGGLWVYPIVLLGAASLLIALWKLLSLTRLAQLQPQWAAQLLQANTAEQTELTQGNGWQQQLGRLALTHRHCPTEILADKMHHQLLLWKAELELKMGLLAATATVAPLLGLLGTVSGMIHTFEMMNLFGNQDQNMLAGGISEALITTELGLMVAVPTLLLYAYLTYQHQNYLAQLEADSILLSELEPQITPAHAAEIKGILPPVNTEQKIQ